MGCGSSPKQEAQNAPQQQRPQYQQEPESEDYRLAKRQMDLQHEVDMRNADNEAARIAADAEYNRQQQRLQEQYASPPVQYPSGETYANQPRYDDRASDYSGNPGVERRDKVTSPRAMRKARENRKGTSAPVVEEVNNGTTPNEAAKPTRTFSRKTDVDSYSSVTGAGRATAPNNPSVTAARKPRSFSVNTENRYLPTVKRDNSKETVPTNPAPLTPNKRILTPYTPPARSQAADEETSSTKRSGESDQPYKPKTSLRQRYNDRVNAGGGYTPPAPARTTTRPSGMGSGSNSSQRNAGSRSGNSYGSQPPQRTSGGSSAPSGTGTRPSPYQRQY